MNSVLLKLECVYRATTSVISFAAIILTVDSVCFGYREADARNGFNALPPPHRLVHYDELRKQNTAVVPGQHAAWDQNTELMFDPTCSWKDVSWVKEQIQIFAHY